MRANKWRGTEIARHGYSTRFGAGGSISKRRSEANGAGRLRAWRCCHTRTGQAACGRRRSSQGRSVLGCRSKTAAHICATCFIGLSHVVIAKPLRTFARHALVAGASAALAHALPPCVPWFPWLGAGAVLRLAWSVVQPASATSAAITAASRYRGVMGSSRRRGNGLRPPRHRTGHGALGPGRRPIAAGQRQCRVPGVTISPNDGSGRARRQVGVRRATQAAREKKEQNRNKFRRRGLPSARKRAKDITGWPFRH